MNASCLTELEGAEHDVGYNAGEKEPRPTRDNKQVTDGHENAAETVEECAQNPPKEGTSQIKILQNGGQDTVQPSEDDQKLQEPSEDDQKSEDIAQPSEGDKKAAKIKGNYASGPQTCEGYGQMQSVSIMKLNPEDPITFDDVSRTKALSWREGLNNLRYWNLESVQRVIATQNSPKYPMTNLKMTDKDMARVAFRAKELSLRKTFKDSGRKIEQKKIDPHPGLETDRRFCNSGLTARMFKSLQNIS